ncbi:foldase protein PrsA [Sinobaca qinghaiensis]|uniref:Foldase protein PrsA n=1 Tax=Sinobaca qinghaiensis TaxID=342944 RepID=A0A419V4S7_9BACL|nr:peptidylprolyl isomerase [Sinobaca qinghaiensis]RKD73442.1 foldase protein PrsA [Sinobaca qinghaiensis]
MFKKGKKRYFIGAIIAAAVIGLLITGFSRSDAVAEVGDEKITKDELYEEMAATSGEAALDTMITEEVVNAEAEKAEVKVTQKEIDEEKATLEESYGGEEGLESAISQSGLTMEDLEEQMETTLKVEKLMEADISVSDEEIETYYEENKEDLGEPAQVEASHILTEDKETAEEIKAKLDNGENFAEIAEEYSTDTASAENGGELGFFGTGEMAEAFEKAAFDMEPGEISEPVETEFGFHIINVTDKKEAEEAALEDSRAEIEETLKNQKLDANYTTWLEKTKEKYDIKNSLMDEQE